MYLLQKVDRTKSHFRHSCRSQRLISAAALFAYRNGSDGNREEQAVRVKIGDYGENWACNGMEGSNRQVGNRRQHSKYAER